MSRSVLQFRIELAVKNKNRMTLLAPMVGQVASCVLDNPNSKVSFFDCLPVGRARYAQMLVRLKCLKVKYLNRYVADVHCSSDFTKFPYKRIARNRLAAAFLCLSIL